MTSIANTPGGQSTSSDEAVLVSRAPEVPLPPRVDGAPQLLKGDTDQQGSEQRRRRRRTTVHPTRISGAWAAVFVAVALGVALIDFIVENTRKVRIDFFGANGHIPVAVALLAAALAGAFVVLAIGMCRTAQLRLVLRRRAKTERKDLVD